MLKVRKLLSYVFRTFHFEDTEDFEAHRYDLFDGASVAFDNPLKVLQNEVFDRESVITLSDQSGDIQIYYPFHVELIDGVEFPPHPFNDPVYGAERGDLIRVCSSSYTGGRLEIPAAYFVKNDMHFERVGKERERLSNTWK